MRDLKEIRADIDAIDHEIVAQLERRLVLADEIAAAKRVSGKGVTDVARERVILAQIADQVGGDFSEDVTTIFRTIFAVSKARQRQFLNDELRMSPD